MKKIIKEEELIEVLKDSCLNWKHTITLKMWLNKNIIQKFKLKKIGETKIISLKK